MDGRNRRKTINLDLQVASRCIHLGAISTDYECGSMRIDVSELKEVKMLIVNRSCPSIHTVSETTFRSVGFDDIMGVHAPYLH